MAFSDDFEIDRGYATTYLTLHGWSRVRQDELKEIWSSPSDTRVILPLQRLDDYQALMATVVARVAEEETRAEDDVLIDLAWPAYDKLVARTKADRSSPAVPIQEALSLNDALRDLIVAAARAAERPARTYAGGWSASVGEYFDQVRMIPSMPGSYALRALLPLNPEPPEDILLEEVDTARTRKVTQTLLSGVAAARQAGEDRAAGGRPEVFEETVDQGVSADLLDALVRLGGAADDPSPVEISVSWTYAAPMEPAPAISIPAGLLPVLSQGADILRGSPEQVAGTITGVIIRLHRRQRLGPGEITIEGYVDSRLGSSTRNVKVELDEKTYEQAIEAHRSGTTVRVQCQLEYGHSRLTVRRVDRLDTVPSS